MMENKNSSNMRTIIKVLAIVLVAVVCLAVSGCSSCDRYAKSVDSNINGGLERTVTLYSNDGTEIKGWDGKIDLTNSEEEIMFDLDGKRVVIHGGIVVVEEN